MKRYRCTEKVNCDQTLEAMKDGVNIIELREKYAKREVFKEFINSMEYEKPYYLQLDKSVFTDGYSKHLAVDLKYREATQQEKDLERAVRFYEAFQSYVYRSRNKYCQEKRGRGLAGYMVDMKITVPLGIDLNEVMEKLSEEWEQTFREKGEE